MVSRLGLAAVFESGFALVLCGFVRRLLLWDGFVRRRAVFRPGEAREEQADGENSNDGEESFHGDAVGDTQGADVNVCGSGRASADASGGRRGSHLS